MRWLAILLLAACARGHDRHDASCPGETIVANDRSYCLVTCAGALEDGIAVPGFEYTGRYDDGLVFVTVAPGTRPVAPPPEVCARLPHGCACTTPACTYMIVDSLTTDGRGRLIREPVVAPRCRYDDPNCGPIAFSHTCTTPARDRHAVAVPTNRGPCDGDGDCIVPACRDRCDSTRLLSTTTDTCDANPEIERKLATAQCGCVQGACAWFTP
jgi:hypothetical protein